MEFTAIVFGHATFFQAAQHQTTSYWRITWLNDDTVDLLHKDNDHWASHTASPRLTKKLGAIIDKELSKLN